MGFDHLLIKKQYNAAFKLWSLVVNFQKEICDSFTINQAEHNHRKLTLHAKGVEDSISVQSNQLF